MTANIVTRQTVLLSMCIDKHTQTVRYNMYRLIVSHKATVDADRMSAKAFRLVISTHLPRSASTARREHSAQRRSRGET